MNRLLILSAVLCLCGCSNDQLPEANKPGEHKKDIVTKSVAIITPVTHPALEDIQQGFTETLLKQGDYNCKVSVFNANGNETLLRSQAEKVVRGNYDLIFTIGAHATCTIKELIHKTNSKTPFVFGVVAQVEKLGIVSSIELMHNKEL